MILYSVTVYVRPDQLGYAKELFGELTRASRAVDGVESFDILQDPQTPGRFVSVEVYRDQATVDRQGGLPELAKVMDAFDFLLTGPPCGTQYDGAAATPWPAAKPDSIGGQHPSRPRMEGSWPRCGRSRSSFARWPASWGRRAVSSMRRMSG